MDDKDRIIYCSRCGAEMKASSRYCMKCGNLNYDHEDNKSIQHIRPKEERTAYQVGSGHSMFQNTTSSGNSVRVATNTGNDKICFFVNYGIYLFVVLLCFFLSFHGEYTLSSIITSSFPITVIGISIVFLYWYAIQLIFVKSDHKWWHALIPIYNNMILADIAFHNKYLGLLIFVPGIGEIFSLVMLYQLGKKFHYNGWLTLLFPFIMILFMAFGVHTYEGLTFVNLGEELSIEKNYRYKKLSLMTSLFWIVIGVSSIVYTNFDSLEEYVPFFSDAYYVYVAKKVVKHVQENVEQQKVTCNDTTFGTGVYRFNYSDVGDEMSILFYIFHEPMSCSVIVDTTQGETQYSVSLTDENKGFSFVDVNTLSKKDVVSFNTIPYDTVSASECQITK